jgi:LEA14-like dessication related protein
MDYVIKFKGVKLHVFGMDGIVFDLVLAFTNNSDIGFKIVSQQYKAYLNNKLVSEVKSDKEQTIAANATSDIAVNVKFSPRSILSAVNINEFVTSKQNIDLKVDIKVKVGLGPIKIAIPYTYTTSLKELMSGTGQPKA